MPRTPRPLKLPALPLIAFDLDGTLINTESVSLPDMVAYLNEEHGIPITLPHWHAHYAGMSGQSLLDKLAAEYGKHLNLIPFMRRRQERLATLFTQGLPPAPGMLQVIRQLHAAGMPICIVTNSPPQRVELTLANVTGQHSAGVNLAQVFKGRIHTSITREGTGKSKPAPDVYLAAARAHNINPKHALAIEDTATGVTSAATAGFRTWGYTGLAAHPEVTTPKLLAAGAKKTFSHWDDFLPLLAKLKPKKA